MCAVEGQHGMVRSTESLDIWSKFGDIHDKEVVAVHI